MAGMNERHHRLRRRGEIFDLRMGRRVVRKPDVRAALRHFLQHVVDRQDVDDHVELRITHAEIGEHLVHQHVDITLAGDDAHVAGLQPPQCLQALLEQFLLRAAPAPVLEQMRGCLGRLHAARLPLEQLDADLLLEQTDLPCDHGRRGVDAVGRAADGAVGQHLMEVAQAALVEFAHGVSGQRDVCVAMGRSLPGEQH
jgi:hypothetical protein